MKASQPNPLLRQAALAEALLEVKAAEFSVQVKTGSVDEAQRRHAEKGGANEALAGDGPLYTSDAADE